MSLLVWPLIDLVVLNAPVRFVLWCPFAINVTGKFMIMAFQIFPLNSLKEMLHMTPI